MTDYTPFRLRTLVRMAEECFRISPAAMSGVCKARYHSWPRQVLCYVATQRFGFSTTQVGTMIGKDHTTVIHGRDVVAQRIADGHTQVRAMVAALLWRSRRLPLTRSAAVVKGFKHLEAPKRRHRAKPKPIGPVVNGWPKQKPCIAGCGRTVILRDRNDLRKCPDCRRIHADLGHLEGVDEWAA